MLARILIVTLAVTALAGSARAADPPINLYAGQQTRSIKALSQEDITALRKGEGMGMAKAAELNGYPGPMHVLTLAQELGLSPDQVQRITGIRERMSAAAKPLGDEIIAREEELDRLFVRGQITPERLSAETAAIGERQGRLRSVHLTAHLETRALLTAEQLAGYEHLRGYGNPAAPPHQHSPG